MVNATNNLDIMALTNGTIVDGNVVDIENLNIRIVTDPENIGSVGVELSGPINLNRTENIIPYAVFGDQGFGAYTSESLLPGTYVLSATAFSERKLDGENLGETFTISFEVTENSKIEVEDITITPNSSILEIGGTLQLSAIISPQNATNQEVLWISNNESVATVDSGGMVKAVAEGSTEILGQTSDGNFTASASIIVNPAPIVLPIVSLTTENFADEGNSISIIISLDNPSNESISFDLNYVDITTNQADYNSVLESITFLSGETEKTIIIETINDNSEEGDEIFQIEFIPYNQKLINNSENLIVEAKIIDNDSEEGVKLFPNPSEPSTNVTLSGIQLGVYEVTIFSMSGKLIATRIVDIDSNAYEFTMPTHISNGLYMLQVQSVDNVYVTKILIR